MVNAVPYAFRASNPGSPVYMLAGSGRVWVNGSAMAARLGVDLSTVRQLELGDPLFSLPIIGPVPG